MSTPPDHVQLNCMVKIIQCLKQDSENQEELFQTLDKFYPREVLVESVTILKEKGFINSFCYGTALELTDKGHETVKQFIKSGLEVELQKKTEVEPVKCEKGHDMIPGENQVYTCPVCSTDKKDESR